MRIKFSSVMFSGKTIAIHTRNSYREIRFGYQQPLYWKKHFKDKTTRSLRLWLFHVSKDTMRNLWNDVFVRVLGFSILFRQYV